MKKQFLLLLVLSGWAATGQNLYFPLEYKQAYENGTRSLDGKVSDKYWQNRASYDLKAKIDPAGKLLEGQAQITYYNESPDSLDYLVIQAYHNLYRPGAAKAGFFNGGSNDDLLTDGMVIDKIEVEGKRIRLKDEEQFVDMGTNYQVFLKSPMPPNSEIQLAIDWHYTIPGEGFERSGAIDNTSMFIAYWYPEIAVYDDLHTWDVVTYDASSEFYHDVSDYKVQVEAPSNFAVWASSPLLNSEEVLPQKLLDRYKKAAESNSKVTIIGQEEIDKGFKMKSNIWKYEAKGFRDFAFALSDHFIWEASSYEDVFGKFFLHSAYNPDNKGFATVLDGQKKSLEVFHTQFPKHPFPYQHFTIFNGLEGGGMEFPGMANDEANSGAEFSEYLGKEVSDFEANLGLTLHEMYHMYFPFLMGINEKRYGWMDEGWADFADYFIPDIYESDNSNEYIGRHWVVPLMVPTYTRPNHSWINSYTIGSYSYYSLYHLLGEELFDRCMKDYIQRWEGKHPTPYDYFFTFNDASGMDLNWFWQKWYFDFGYADLGIVGLEGNKLTIKNEGGRPLAFELVYTDKDGKVSSEAISPAVWNGANTYIHSVENSKNVASIKLKILGGSDVLAENNLLELN